MSLLLPLPAGYFAIPNTCALLNSQGLSPWASRLALQEDAHEVIGPLNYVLHTVIFILCYIILVRV
jgi:hypothetical protein